MITDVHMPGLSGPELLATLGNTLPVIIVSGDRDFAVESYRYNVVDYLLKPVDFSAFARAWNKVAERAAPSSSNTAVFVRVGAEIVRIDLDEVRYIKSDSNYVRFLLADKEVTSLMNLKDLERKLPSDFIRVHRSYIVHLRHIDKLDSQDIKIGRALVPVSDSYREELLKRLALQAPEDRAGGARRAGGETLRAQASHTSLFLSRASFQYPPSPPRRVCHPFEVLRDAL
ncbi:MAG: response regulator transcription factor [Flavobacteriales bacterium]|nr:response regulator transcription factor [Flavobacteriales bacterium]